MVREGVDTMAVFGPEPAGRQRPLPGNEVGPPRLGGHSSLIRVFWPCEN